MDVLTINYDDLAARPSPAGPEEAPADWPGSQKDDSLWQDRSVLTVAEVEATIDIDDLGVVIPWGKIESFSIYNPHVHEAHSMLARRVRRQINPGRPVKTFSARLPVPGRKAIR